MAAKPTTTDDVSLLANDDLALSAAESATADELRAGGQAHATSLGAASKIDRIRRKGHTLHKEHVKKQKSELLEIGRQPRRPLPELMQRNDYNRREWKHTSLTRISLSVLMGLRTFFRRSVMPKR